MDENRDWLVWEARDRLWWKPGGMGYTRKLDEAGRFTESEALRHQMSSDLTVERRDVAIPLSAVASPSASAPLLVVDRYATLRIELRTYLDTLTITGDTIGTIRRSLFVPWDSEWNGLVRDETAAREVAAAAPRPTPADTTAEIFERVNRHQVAMSEASETHPPQIQGAGAYFFPMTRRKPCAGCGQPLGVSLKVDPSGFAVGDGYQHKPECPTNFCPHGVRWSGDCTTCDAADEDRGE